MPDEPTYRIWVNPGRTLLVRLWPNGLMELARRPDPSATWGPPIVLEEE